jgi:hypothetical protein
MDLQSLIGQYIFSQGQQNQPKKNDDNAAPK